MIVVSGGAAAVQRIWNAEAALADRDLAAARRWADEAVVDNDRLVADVGADRRAPGWRSRRVSRSRPNATPTTRWRAPPKSRRTCAFPTSSNASPLWPARRGSHREAARLFGAAEAIRQRMGAVRFKIYDAGYEASVAALRDAMGEKDFDSAWAEGAALSTEEAIAYAQRGRGERKRPTSGWASLTPTERDVVRLVSEGLANNDIATRLFVSPRTVQTHLTHVYTKLGLTSRVQLAQEAARHA